MTTPMPETMSPREKVEPSLDDLLRKAVETMNSWTPEQREAHFEAQKKAWVAAEMAFGDEGTRVVTPPAAALASSGDHAELARLAEAATARLAGPSLSADDFGYQIWGDSQKGGDTHVLDVRGWGYLTGKGAGALGLSDAEAMSAQRAIQRYAVAAWNAVPALLAEVAALRGERDRNWEEYLAERQARMDHGSREAGYLDQIDKLNSRATEAERKLAEAEEVIKEIAAIEPKPFDGGLDMEAIRACEECRRYEGHPVQHGICNTHRRPIWDREKHDSREEKALGYRAKSIARTFLSSKEAERG